MFECIDGDIDSSKCAFLPLRVLRTIWCSSLVTREEETSDFGSCLSDIEEGCSRCDKCGTFHFPTASHLLEVLIVVIVLEEFDAFSDLLRTLEGLT